MKQVRHPAQNRPIQILAQVVLALALAACAPAGLSLPPSSCVVNIGIVNSLTGDLAPTGLEYAHGYEMALDAINSAGGLKVKTAGGQGCKLALVTKDDHSTADGAADLVAQLDEKSKVAIILGAMSSDVTLKLVPAATQRRLPLLAQDATSFLVTSTRSKWVFRTLPPSSDTVDAVLTFAMEQKAIGSTPSIAIVYQDNASGQSVAVAVMRYAKAAGISVVAIDSFTTVLADFQRLAQHVKDANPDIIFMSATTISSAQALKDAMHTVGLQPKLYLSHGGASLSPEFLPLSPIVISPALWADREDLRDLADNLTGSTAGAFINAYHDKYGIQPGYRSVNAYMNVFLAKYAIEQAAGANVVSSAGVVALRQGVRDSLAGLNMTQTMLGPIRFNASGQNEAAQILVVQNSGDQFRVVSDTVRTYPVEYPPWVTP